jgi:hypothetical protein
MRKSKAADIALATAHAAYNAYCKIMDDELDTLYENVRDDFSTYYRAVNEDDEAAFTAKLTPSEGRLDFDVNFYERGLFPPGAYHSEGHQDGMGVCLYLALMKRLFGDRFKFALLDDVVMSVDAGHRYQFCKLLRTYFPDTQFIITTHDRVWAEQMKSAGLVTAKTSLTLHGWTIESGPLVASLRGKTYGIKSRMISQREMWEMPQGNCAATLNLHPGTWPISSVPACHFVPMETMSSRSSCRTPYPFENPITASLPTSPNRGATQRSGILSQHAERNCRQQPGHRTWSAGRSTRQCIITNGPISVVQILSPLWPRSESF